jgi:uncharacterized protein YbaR (Trm112 family)
MPIEIEDQLLKFLRCPNDLSPLVLADDELLQRLNRAIEMGHVMNLGGEPVLVPLEQALVSESSARLYPIVKQIPVMLPSEAISLGQLSPR